MNYNEPVADFLCAPLMAKEMVLATFARSLFRLNGSNGQHNCFCNQYVENCAFALEGPHRNVRLGLAETSLVAMHVEHGFSVVHKPSAALGRPFACAAMIACLSCDVELYDAHTLLMVIGRRTDTLFKLLQYSNERLTAAGPVPLVRLMEVTGHPETRTQLRLMFAEAHRPTCRFYDQVLYANVMDAFHTNRFVNQTVGHRCETCLYGMVERELFVEMRLTDPLLGGGRSSRRSIDNNEAITTNADETTNASSDSSTSQATASTTKRDTVDVTCRCCFSERAQVNVPCGHLFFCEKCRIRSFEANEARDTLSSSNPVCSVCRSPVYIAVDLYD